MSSHDSHLYGIPRPRQIAGTKEISSANTLAFTSTLSSLINASASQPTTKPASRRPRPRTGKDDLFHTPNRHTAKRAKRDLEDSPAFAVEPQRHSTNASAPPDPGLWERSRRRMEDKARLYAALKRGDVDDDQGRFAVDFDRKWAEAHDGDPARISSDEDEDEDDKAGPPVSYVDEFGRTRTGTQAEAARAARGLPTHAAEEVDDRITARPRAPERVIRGDAVQHAAFDPDARVVEAMAELARKRDASLTPPPDTHFDSRAEMRAKGTGFFAFAVDGEERRRQMEGLEEERKETERRRGEGGEVVVEVEVEESRGEKRKRRIEERRREVGKWKGRKKAEKFLEALGEELGEKVTSEAAAAETAD